MDGFSFQFEADAAEAEGYVPKASEPGTPQSESTKDAQTAGGKNDSLPTLGSMLGFAASWGKKLQSDLQLDQLVDQVKKQSEEVTKAYKQDITEFAQAVKVGATRGMDEISTRFSQMKTDLEAELKDSDEDKAQLAEESTRAAGDEDSRDIDTLKQRQEKAKRLMGKLGADLEDLLRDAIVIEAPGSASTEEQRNTARKIIYDRRMAQLAAIQESEDTYLVDPSTHAIGIPGMKSSDAKGKEPETGDSEARGEDELKNTPASGFAEFAKDFELSKKKDDVDALLKDNSVVAEMHKKLVSEKVADKDFWTRYYFHVWAIDQEELRRKKLVEAAVAATEEEDFSWDMDGESDSEAQDRAAESKAESTSGDGSKENAQMDASAEDSAGADKDGAEPPAKGASLSAHSKDSETKSGAGSSPKDSGTKGADDDDAWDEWE
ncbi:hypothetical protein GQ54DRAFT_258811 [Martensiomyces pterosporus]|nr:hypothetical protein GQ54DRAFT_258811 [Martensiomyces pterosporus]